jgi:hypothetical protein
MMSPLSVNYHDYLDEGAVLTVDTECVDDKWMIHVGLDLSVLMSPARAIELRDAIDAAAAKVVRGVATASSAPVHDPSEEG